MSAFMIAGIIICALNWLFALLQIILYCSGARKNPVSLSLVVAIVMTVTILKS